MSSDALSLRQPQAGENAELQAHIRLLQSSLEVLQASNASLETEKSGLAEKGLKPDG